ISYFRITVDSLKMLERIEWVVDDLIMQITEGRKLILRASLDETDHQLHYNKSTLRKLAVNCRNLAQMYHLIKINKKSTLRDLYYDHKHLYVKQEALNRSVSHLCQLLSVTRSHLNVTSCSKGLVFGNLCLKPMNGEEETPIDCSKEPLLISESFVSYLPSSSARFIVVVEKDATFQKLIDDGFPVIYPSSILVTGKGYPDLITREFLHGLVDRLNICIFGLFDADPHGMEIFLTYKYGSSTSRVEGRSAVVPSIQWLGLRPSERDTIPIAHNQLLAMVNADHRKSARVRKRAETLKEDQIVQELDVLRERPFKMELEAVSSAGLAFLPTFYLNPKLRHLLTEL
ncbi:hypothetical protein PFISCL1PPCAC_15608, partial [Pristionchus fissidentatus]